MRITELVRRLEDLRAEVGDVVGKVEKSPYGQPDAIKWWLFIDV